MVWLNWCETGLSRLNVKVWLRGLVYEYVKLSRLFSAAIDDNGSGGNLHDAPQAVNHCGAKIYISLFFSPVSLDQYPLQVQRICRLRSKLLEGHTQFLGSEGFLKRQLFRDVILQSF